MLRHFARREISTTLNNTMNKSLKLLSLAAVLALAARADAGIVFQVGPGGGNPDENVLFNQNGLVTTGTTVMGATNQTHAVLDMTSQQGFSLQASGGQASLERVGGGSFGSVLFTPNSSPPTGLGISLVGLASFTDLKFNIHATSDGLVTLLVNNSVSSGLLPLDANGQNFFRITADGSDTITSLLVTTSGGDLITDVKQIRLGGLTAPPGDPPIDPVITPDPVLDPTVPEPASIILWSVIGAVGLGMRLRRSSPAGR